MFNLKDPQSHFGEWVSLFMDAAKISEGKSVQDLNLPSWNLQPSDLLSNVCCCPLSDYPGWKEENITVITQEFVSRHQLIQCIANLAFLKERSPSGVYLLITDSI